MSNVNEFYNPSASPRTLEILRRIESLESSIKRITCSELEKRKEIENLKIDQIRCKKVKAELRAYPRNDFHSKMKMLTSFSVCVHVKKSHYFQSKGCFVEAS